MKTRHLGIQRTFNELNHANNNLSTHIIISFPKFKVLWSGSNISSIHHTINISKNIFSNVHLISYMKYATSKGGNDQIGK